MRYEKYKDSGISWLPLVPETWEVKKARFLFAKLSRPVKDDYETVTCFRDGEVTLRKNRRTTGFTESLQENGYQGVMPGDLVIHQMDAFAGSTGVSDSEGKCTPVYSVCRPIDSSCNVYYYAHIVRLMGHNGYIKSLYKGIRERSSDFRFDTFAQQILPLPPLPEQQAIVTYLDTKTALIDKAIEGKLRQQTLLREAKQSLIAEAVTKGINHNVALKDSGISWLGEIPEHWEVKRMKFCFTQTSIKGFPCEQPLCSTQTYGVIPQAMYENRIVVANAGLENQKLVNVGDFVISLRSFEGGIEYAYYRGIISAAYTILSPNDATMSPYNKCLFKSFPFIQLLKTCVTGIREGQNINYDLLKNKFLPVPPLAEQQAIVDYIESKTQKIDTMITTLDKQVEQLKAYRQRLIADVVTGQMKVC